MPTFEGETQMIVQDSGSAGSWSALSIISGTTGRANLYFGDKDNDNQGFVTYYQSADAFGFGTGGSERIRIDSTGNVGVASTSPGSLFSINNVANFSTASSTLYNQIWLDTDRTATALIEAGTGASVSNLALSISDGRSMIGYNNTSIAGGSGALSLGGGTNKGIEFFVGGTNGNFLSGTRAMYITHTAKIGNGTTTPNWLVTNVSGTGPQLSLGDGTGGITHGQCGHKITISTSLRARTLPQALSLHCALTLTEISSYTVRVVQTVPSAMAHRRRAVHPRMHGSRRTLRPSHKASRLSWHSNLSHSTGMRECSQTVLPPARNSASSHKMSSRSSPTSSVETRNGSPSTTKDSLRRS